MKCTLKTMLWLIPACLIWLVVLYWLVNRDEWRRSRPDMATRSTVADITSNDVAAAVLDTPPDFLVLTPTGTAPVGVRHIQGFKQMYKVTRNPSAISLLLNGLKEATTPPVISLNKVSSITLYLKNGGVVGPFGFSPTIRVDCFSPTFIEGLKAAGIKQIPRHPMPHSD